MRFEGSGEAVVPVAPATAFAFLADPRNASAWFAGAGFVARPQGPPRTGEEWSFAETPGTRRVTPTHMTRYEPPEHFRWETRLSAWQTNFAWEMRCEPDSEGTRLRFTIQLRPGLLEYPAALIGFRLTRRALARAAERTAEQAAEALTQRQDQGRTGAKRVKPRRPRR